MAGEDEEIGRAFADLRVEVEVGLSEAGFDSQALRDARGEVVASNAGP